MKYDTDRINRIKRLMHEAEELLTIIEENLPEGRTLHHELLALIYIVQARAYSPSWLKQEDK